MKYDVAVMGLGGMGSAILAHCAARGASAIGVEQYQPAHDLGSSHGKTRMIRKAYFEDQAYVPLLCRADELWRELEHAAGARILTKTGVLTVGEAGSEIITGTRRASAEHDLPLQSFSPEEVGQRYPAVRMLPEEVALLEEDAGVLDPEGAITAHLKIARSHGAEMRFDLAMQSWEATDGGVDLLLADGERVTARTLVLALGPWFKRTMEALGVPIRIQRNVQAWFAPGTSAWTAPGSPAFLIDRRGLPAPLYGFPDFGDGIKCAFHGGGTFTEVDELDRVVNTACDVEPLIHAMETCMPGVLQTLRHASVCIYTMSPDEHFVVDRDPRHENVILCGGFSGHGFKFASVIGEIAAQLALEGGTQHAIDFLSLRRFRNGEH
ncbi:MAG: N-methyl-L-tryptophan oxidase [Chthoniobacterales bacterium]